jgi:hypothetical protein
MRKLAFVVVALGGLTGGFVGCGGTSSRKPVVTGKAGSGGTAGTTGVAGTTGAAGDTSVAGTTGAAGDTSVAGTGGAGGAAGGAAGDTSAAGTGGGAGTAPPPPPPPTYCESHPTATRPLPYNPATDFKVIHILSNNNSAGSWINIANPTCDATTFPAFPPPPSDAGASDGGTDAGPDGAAGAGDAPGTDGGADADDAAAGSDGDTNDAPQQLQLAGDDGGVDDAPDGGGTDAPASGDGGGDAAQDGDASASDSGDASTGDVVASDGGGDAGPPLPACYEFSYDPDLCTAGACWAGVVFQIQDVQGPTTDGVCITPGAMSVEFWARSSRANARIKFGSIGEAQGREVYINITTTWARYTVPIPAAFQNTYNSTSINMNGVWNSFSVVVEPQDHVGGSYILVKDIRWIAQ